MKAVWLALVFLVFNICMGAVAQSGLLTSAPYYEDEIIEHYEDLDDFQNMSKTDLEAQTIDMWDFLLNVVTFNWLNQYTILIGIHDEALPFIYGLNAIALFFYAVAAIEFFWRQSISG
jgi:hypothetical protein